jgi:hypothetical protein
MDAAKRALLRVAGQFPSTAFIAQLLLIPASVRWVVWFALLNAAGALKHNHNGAVASIVAMEAARALKIRAKLVDHLLWFEIGAQCLVSDLATEHHIRFVAGNRGRALSSLREKENDVRRRGSQTLI